MNSFKHNKSPIMNRILDQFLLTMGLVLVARMSKKMNRRGRKRILQQYEDLLHLTKYTKEWRKRRKRRAVHLMHLGKVLNGPRFRLF